MEETARNQETADVMASIRARIESAREDFELPAYKCAECSDSGMKIVPWKGGQAATPCECSIANAASRRMVSAGVPPRYAGATIENFRTDGLERSVLQGFAAVKMAAREAPVGSGARGLLLCGTCGTGKTHLAVGLLCKSMTTYGVTGRFWNIGKLLSEIRFTFGKDGSGDTERKLRGQLESVDVLVLDDLGAERSTDWAADQVVQIINDRYDAGRVTHITTNYPNLGVGEGSGRGETLGDRIGARMFSRVQEMCLAVEMNGQDFRRRKG